MFIFKKLCPVPFDQQPLNEYISLKKSCFFSWSVLNIDKYLNRILSIFTFLFLLLSPFVFSLMPYYKNEFQLILLNTCIVNFIFIIIFMRLYLGWSYIVKRLVSATVFYEESGWYDGQIWIKTVESLTKDRLIGLYEVTPFVKRIKCSLFISIMSFIIENLIFYLL
uniref:Ycf36 n=1 Tax=Leiomenia cribrosa TaxID=217483 RepID=A0A4D6X0U2_9FLOR|nr:hypothetical protein [Leiomenia cribrosa]